MTQRHHADRRRAIRSLIIVAGAAICLGCGGSSGPQHYPVSGKVSFEGEPVTKGSIQFANSQFGSGSGQLGEDGAYEIDGGLVPGNYKVMIVAPTPTTPPDFRNPAATMRRPEPVPNIPPKYRATRTSGFSADVTDDEEKNKFDFNMEGK